ncbi:lactoylglutathione lyase [Clostridium acidisoli DSM 12555]|uniref:Aldoketomutase n=1 Tax=Clostridium acidisoli DSM 12555 TaxID=1121291 RepID=A0A1W1XLC0_9CLOT|nr:VOC family protein [Clostridium acidisoli]SMC24614.1 lactoylglutathione lyase [Clostridium acidisoli DSM 12555]
MKFNFIHNNINIFDLEKSLAFYEEALGFKEVKRKNEENGEFILVYLEDGETNYQLELTWLRDRKEPYNLGDNEIHMAVRTDDFDGAYEKHKKMDCICFENHKMGLYFISDPDGYWTEILPNR